MTALQVCLLLALVAATCTLGDAVASCGQTDVTVLKDTLRQSACRLRANRTEGEEFRASVRAKHGLPDSSSSGDFFAFANLFVLTTAKAWCRSTCPDIAPENVTWCVQIAYLERNVEVCVRPGADQAVVITNISCEAELVGLANHLSFPSDCSPFGGVACLGLSNLDWFFQDAYLTCTVNTDTCSEKSFTQLLTHSSVAQPPVFELFPSSPHVVLLNDTMVLHAEISTTTERILISWHHSSEIYSNFILEDPFCNPRLEECNSDTHPEAPTLRQQRIRVYRTTRDINLDGCQTSRIYRISTYLVIDNAREEDSGEYTLNVTATYPGFSPVTVTRSVNTSIMCQPLQEEATCGWYRSPSFVIAEGSTVDWECQLLAAPTTNFSLVLNNKKTTIFPSQPGAKCGSESQVILFSVQEETMSVCFSSFNFTVFVCSANEGMVGEFSIISSTGDVVSGASVTVTLIIDPTTTSEPSITVVPMTEKPDVVSPTQGPTVKPTDEPDIVSSSQDLVPTLSYLITIVVLAILVPLGN